MPVADGLLDDLIGPFTFPPSQELKIHSFSLGLEGGSFRLSRAADSYFSHFLVYGMKCFSAFKAFYFFRVHIPASGLECRNDVFVLFNASKIV